MKVAITGETRLAREELVARGVQAGLNMMTSVSRHTSLLVTNDAGSGSAKAERALEEGVPVIDESTFVRLLGSVRPGDRHEQTGPEPQPLTDRIPVQAVPPRPASGLLAGRRVLVLAADHAEAAAARQRLAELGAAAAVNLSASVTDVLALPGAERDKRWTRIKQLALPVRDERWLRNPAATETAGSDAHNTAKATGQDQVADEVVAPQVLARGQVVDLPARDAMWTITASWATTSDVEVDLVAFVLDRDEQVTCDDGMVFWNNPEAFDGAVALTSNGPTEQGIRFDVAALPEWATRVTVAAAIDGQVTFGDIGAVEVAASPGEQGACLVQATLDAATSERTLSLVEVYRRGEVWRLRAVGQGWDSDLATLAREFGVDVEQ